MHGDPTGPLHLPPLAVFAGGFVLGLGGALTTPAAAVLAAPCLAWVAAGRPGRTLAGGLLLGLVLGSVPRPAAREPSGLDRLRLPALHVLEGRVVEASLPSADTRRLTLAAERVGHAPVSRVGVRLGVPSGGDLDLRVGDCIRVPARLTRFPRARNPGDLDRAARWRRKGVHLRGWVASPRHVSVVARASTPSAAVADVRRSAARLLDACLEPADAGLARALVLGDRSTLSLADRRRFALTGQGHLVAVSGLHVGLVLAGLVFLLRRAGVGETGVCVAGLAATAFYVPFAGAAPSALRAGAAAALYFAGRLLRRRVSAPAILAAVVVAYLVVVPVRLGDAALTLSLSAVLGILLLVRPLTRELVPDLPVVPGLIEARPAFFRRALAVALAAWLGTAPLLAGVIGRLCLVAAPLSVLTVPVTAVLIGAAFLVVLEGALLGGGGLGVVAVEVLAWLLRLLLDAVEALGWGARRANVPGPLWVVLYVAALLAVGLARRGVARVALVVVGVLLVVTVSPAAEPPPVFPRLVLLDVGHGQAAVLRLPDGRSALLDAGRTGDPDVGRRSVVPALQALGVRRVDLAVVSHGDADHAGAIPDVHRELGIDDLVGPPSLGSGARRRLAAAGLVPRTARRGDVLLQGSWGSLDVLGPEASPAPSLGRNDTCLVLRLRTTAGHVLLLPGDRERHGVDALEGSGVDLRADVLVLPHHGRPGGGRDALLAAARPTAVLASCGASVTPALPPGTWSTAVHGALVVDLAADRPRVRAPWAAATEGYDAPPLMLLTAPPLLDPVTAAVAVALALLAVVSVRPFGWLTPGGASGAGVLGVAAWAAFGGAGLAGLLAPFLVASLLGRLPGTEPSGRRTLRQVAANGLPALGGALVALAGEPAIGAAAFLGALACLGADTCATEVGVRYGGVPRSLVSGRAMRRGESGGVTLAGLAGSVAGSFLAPAAWALARGLDTGTLGWLAVAGTAGALLDSVLGATLQYRGRDPATGDVVEQAHTAGGTTTRVSGLRLLDNDAVNLVACLAAALLAVALVSPL